MTGAILKFLRDDSGAVTVDWVVLTAGSVGMAIAATGVVRGGIEELASNIDAQLRGQQISDAFVGFRAGDFQNFLTNGSLTEEQARQVFLLANEKTNSEVLTELEAGILAMSSGPISDPEKAALVALASVALQRNIIEDAVIEGFFPGQF